MAVGPLNPLNPLNPFFLLFPRTTPTRAGKESIRKKGSYGFNGFMISLTQHLRGGAKHSGTGSGVSNQRLGTGSAKKWSVAACVLRIGTGRGSGPTRPTHRAAPQSRSRRPLAGRAGANPDQSRKQTKTRRGAWRKNPGPQNYRAPGPSKTRVTKGFIWPKAFCRRHSGDLV